MKEEAAAVTRNEGDKAPPLKNPEMTGTLGRERDVMWNSVWSCGLVGKKTKAKLAFFSKRENYQLAHELYGK